MGHYKANLRDIEFNLFEVFGRGELLGTGPYADIDEDTARSLLAEMRAIAEGPLAESFTDADRNPPVFDPATSTVTLTTGWQQISVTYVPTSPGTSTIDFNAYVLSAANRSSKAVTAPLPRISTPALSPMVSTTPRAFASSRTLAPAVTG